VDKLDILSIPRSAKKFSYYFVRRTERYARFSKERQKQGSEMAHLPVEQTKDRACLSSPVFSLARRGK